MLNVSEMKLSRAKIEDVRACVDGCAFVYACATQMYVNRVDLNRNGLFVVFAKMLP